MFASQLGRRAGRVGFDLVFGFAGWGSGDDLDDACCSCRQVSKASAGIRILQPLPPGWTEGSFPDFTYRRTVGSEMFGQRRLNSSTVRYSVSTMARIRRRRTNTNRLANSAVDGFYVSRKFSRIRKIDLDHGSNG